MSTLTPLAMLDMAVTSIIKRIETSELPEKCKKKVLEIIGSLKEELEEKQVDWFDEQIWQKQT